MPVLVIFSDLCTRSSLGTDATLFVFPTNVEAAATLVIINLLLYHMFEIIINISVSRHSDGVYGSLVVNQPHPMEPHSALYDYDRSQENTLLVGAMFPVLMTGYLEDKKKLQPSSLVINGYTNGSK